MAFTITKESESSKRQRLIDESIAKIMQAINAIGARHEHHVDKIVVYSIVITRLNGRVSNKERRTTQNVYHKGAKH